MGFLSRFEGKMEDTFEGAADRMANAPISPVQIAKKAEKQMRREKMVGAGKQFAPTLYTVLVNPDDDRRLFGYYPTLAGETETYLNAKAMEHGLVMDGQPLVRFIVDEGLKHGKFEIIAEAVAAPIVVQLRNEEMQRYGLMAPQPAYAAPQQPYYDEYAPEPMNYTEPPYADSLAQEPAPQAYNGPARLVDTEGQKSYNLTASRLTIGRESQNDIALQDLNVSRTHAEICIDQHGDWTLTDLGSTNGTFVNGRLAPSWPLNEGDRITIGLTTFVFTRA